VSLKRRNIESSFFWLLKIVLIFLQLKQGEKPDFWKWSQ
jgi:hypothetical protein